MTIQISVTVWTILCFLALMLVLDRLLFRPLMSFMDKRKEKIDGARLSRENALRAREEEIAQREEDRVAAEQQAMREASAALEELRHENARRVAEKKAENEQKLAALSDTLAEESRSILTALEPQMEALAEAFAGRLDSWRAIEDDAGVEELAAPGADM